MQIFFLFVLGDREGIKLMIYHCNSVIYLFLSFLNKRDILLFFSQTVTSIRQYRMTLEAFSEDHLKTLYFNPLLEQMEGFVEHFIRV